MATQLLLGLSEDAKRNIECSICQDVFIEPKQLTCLHTFCMSCIQNHIVTRTAASLLVSCPLCNAEISTAVTEVRQLPADTRITSLISLYYKPGLFAVERPCDSCTDRLVDIFFYCVECSKILCDRCSEKHPVSTTSDRHTVVGKTDLSLQHVDAVLKKKSSYCYRHKHESLSFFCLSCRMETCSKGIQEFHETHSVLNIETEKNKFIGEFSKILETIELRKQSAANCLSEARRKCKEFKILAKRLLQTIAEKHLAEATENHLKKQIKILKSEHYHESNILQDEIISYIKRTDLFLQYSKQLFSSGTCIDVLRSSQQLTELADDIRKFNCENLISSSLISRENNLLNNIKSIIVEDTIPAKVHRQNLDILKKDTTIDFAGNQAHDTSLVRGGYQPNLRVTMKTSKMVVGITLYEDLLFIALFGSDTLLVYNKEMEKRLNRFTVHGLQDPTDITSSHRDASLYISDGQQNGIYKLTVEGRVIDRWCVSGCPVGLSVNRSSQIVVSCWEDNNIKVFSSNGSLVKVIQLSSAMTSIRHAVQVTCTQYIVCYGEGTQTHGVSVIDSSGVPLTSFEFQSNNECLSYPFHLAADVARCNILTADSENHRIIVMDDSLNSYQVLPLTDKGLRNPWRLCTDNTCQRLYVGQNDKVMLFSLTS